MADLRPKHLAVLLWFPLITACASGPDGQGPSEDADRSGAEAQAEGRASVRSGAGNVVRTDGAGRARGASADEAIAAIRAGEFARARLLVEALAFEDAVTRGRAALAGGAPREALAPLDEALELRPTDKDALFTRAEAAFRTAEAGDPQAGFFYGDAAAGFSEAARHGYGVEAAFRASQAAFLAGDSAGALKIAREGMAWLDAAEGRRAAVSLDVAPEKAWSDAAFGEYVAARNSNADATEARALFAEAEDALGRLAVATPTDAAPFEQLANLYLWEGRRADALARLETALALAPKQESLHNSLARLIGDDAYARALAERGGAEADEAPDEATLAAANRARRTAVIERYDAFQTAHPENALGFWYGAYERFHRALEAYEAGTLQEAEFHHAERDFRQCRELDAKTTDSCRGWEVIARAAIGWCRFWSADLEGAEEAFWSTEDLLEGGLDWEYQGRLSSALVGLASVAGKYAEQTDDLAALTKAAALGDMLFTRRPENANLANNAGFLNRDAAVLYEAAARRKRLEATRLPDGDAVEGERAAAAQLRERAQRLIERSWAAYQVAARLAPDDVRVVNDTGLVMAYYLRTDPAVARGYFRDALALGREQLAAYEAQGEAPPTDLLVAYGDAHQNLGVLALTFDGDLVSAQEWFTLAMQVAPDDRPELVQIQPALAASIAAGAWTEELRQFERMLVWKD